MAVYTFDANTDYSSPSLDLTDYITFSYQGTATGLDASDGVLSVEYSNDGVNFAQVPELIETLASGASDTHLNINAVNHTHYRVNWVANSNTAGSLTVTTSK